MESELRRVGQGEWWLWVSAAVVTVLSGIGFLLTSFHSLFLHNEHFFEIRSEQARWGILSLLLVFDAWLVYRQFVFRRQRRRFTEQAAGPRTTTEEAYDPLRMDAVTGLYTRTSVEQRLGKEVARAKRNNLPLSLVAFHLDDLAELGKRYGSETGELILKEFANRLRKASRGTDFCARLGNDDFLVILTECNLRGAKTVSDRVGTVEMKCGGREVALTCSVGWIDYKPGEVPSDLFKRAGEVLQLYKEASKDSSSTTLIIS
ncbi:MAG: GGDEF domain-containing protein [Candidatus Acidiferrales bacterium]